MRVIEGGGEDVLFFCDATSLVAITAVNISTLIYIHCSEGKNGGNQTVFIVYNVQGANSKNVFQGESLAWPGLFRLFLRSKIGNPPLSRLEVA